MKKLYILSPLQFAFSLIFLPLWFSAASVAILYCGDFYARCHMFLLYEMLYFI